ncbi:MAG: FAD-dependent oxidoreductase [Deltaproteobacteria bacterium]|nr:FAD-dependent oxidoreductase [Deltaproteobacteria bacterium]
MNEKKIIVIGGSAAGPKAAAKAKRVNRRADVKLFQKEPELSMATCGYPYYVGGAFDDRDMLIATPAGVKRDVNFFINVKGVEACVEIEVISIDRKNHKIVCKNLNNGGEEAYEYAKLIICSGSAPKIPPIPGINLKGITPLTRLKDADYLRKIRDEKKIKKAVVVGGGLIGLETCEALKLAGIEVTVVEMLPQILPFLEADFAKLAENYIRSKGVDIIVNDGVVEFFGENEHLKSVKLKSGKELACELAVIAIGVSPNSKLAAEAGLDIGEFNGISVNEYMQTSDSDVYAAGDCVEINHLITNRKMHAPFGDLANLEGRVAGENAALGNCVTFKGALQTGICKIFDFSAGCAGLSAIAAKKAGFTDIVTAVNASPDKPLFMKPNSLISKIIADKKTGAILGYQCIGQGDVGRQITTASLAISGKMKLDDIINLDLPYAPPFSLAIDHFIVSGHTLQNKIKGRMIGISVKEVYERVVVDKEKVFLLDMRGENEYEIMRLGVGEVLIPLGALTKRLSELPSDKNAEIICFCKVSMRGYEAAIILNDNGWKNVKVMEGGIMAWPYSREK